MNSSKDDAMVGKKEKSLKKGVKSSKKSVKSVLTKINQEFHETMKGDDGIPTGDMPLPTLKDEQKLAKKESSKVHAEETEPAETTEATKDKDDGFDMASIKAEIEQELHAGKSKETEDPVFSQKVSRIRKQRELGQKWVTTGVQGFDALLEKGIPKGGAILVCGGPGSGKTIFCLQTLAFAAKKGEKCLYMTFEEHPQRLIDHMYDFGWDGQKMVDSGNLVIQRYNPYDVTRQVEAMLEKAKGELLIDVKPLLFPKGFQPDRIVVDSLSAIASAFIGKQETYRIYIEQLFRIFEDIGATSFLISETSELPKKLTTSGVEEFLADGVIVIYNLRHGDVRESAIECLKLRGASFQKKIAAMQIKGGIGIEVYPEQEVFSDVG
jgi:KaiC/GvpD/RAD55 family RecA-like ATPase